MSLVESARERGDEAAQYNAQQYDLNALPSQFTSLGIEDCATEHIAVLPRSVTNFDV